MVNNPPTNAEDAGSIPESGRSPGEGHSNHSSILAWRIPWTEESAGLHPWGHKSVISDWVHTLLLLLLLLLSHSVVSDSVRPHRRQPTRLLCPWDLQARTLEWVAISYPKLKNGETHSYLGVLLGNLPTPTSQSVPLNETNFKPTGRNR